MERMEAPDYKAEVCAAFAQGNLGKAIKLAGSEHFNELKDRSPEPDAPYNEDGYQ